MKALTNCQILDGSSWISNHAVLVDDGIIRAICPEQEIPGSAEIEDLKGQVLAPGFIDCQVNGGGGVLLNDQPDLNTLKTIASAHRTFGTTGLLPTLISDSWDKMAAMADAIEAAIEQKVPGILGVHFEGPYLNTDRKGVHDAAWIREFENRFIPLIQNRNLGVVLATLAPELVPTDVIKQLKDSGVRVSAGHTNASYEETRQALSAGLTGFTHLFNAMPPLLSREPGVIGAALEDQDSFCGIIVDGHHVHPASLKAAISAKGSDKMMLVTDAMSCVGTPETRFKLGDTLVTVQDGACRTDEGTLAGSNLDMATAVRNSASMLDLSLTTALNMASHNPARFLGLDGQRGQIAVGKVADLIALDTELTVQKSWIAGNE
jgi:N-acetylglucosamine-6-phosphate deacetylase